MLEALFDFFLANLFIEISALLQVVNCIMGRLRATCAAFAVCCERKRPIDLALVVRRSEFFCDALLRSYDSYRSELLRVLHGPRRGLAAGLTLSDFNSLHLGAGRRHVILVQSVRLGRRPLSSPRTFQTNTLQKLVDLWSERCFSFS